MNILCEKPLAATLEQGLAIEKAVKDNGVNFQLAVVTRYGAEQIKYMEMFEQGGYYRDVMFNKENGKFMEPLGGKILVEETDKALREELEKHENAVLPGFYGSTPDGEIKTFSRGGSDITGSLVARAIGAEVYENWTDVSGFLMADPRIVKKPKQIASISYKELRELSYMGASVLHEDAIFPVREMGIPINIRNTNSPADAGTMIVPNEPPRPPPVPPEPIELSALPVFCPAAARLPRP